MRYRKKPVVIEAFQWIGNIDQVDYPLWIIEAMERGDVWFNQIGTDYMCMIIDTLEGNMVASKGDYIIKGINGELYPCKPNIFKRTYELEEV